MSKLTPKQELFCQEYLKDMNGTAAAKRAGYSKRTAAEQACQILATPKIQERVNELKAARLERVQIDADWVLKRIAAIADVDIAKAYDKGGQFLPIKEMPEDLRKTITGIDVYKDFTEGVEVGETRKIKLADKLKALELLGRHIKLFTDKVEHSGKVGWEAFLLEADKDESGEP